MLKYFWFKDLDTQKIKPSNHKSIGYQGSKISIELPINLKDLN